MSLASENENSLRDVGVVVIGRNEGHRLHRALLSIPDNVPVWYSDSGSTDGSIVIAKEMNVAAHVLDTSCPFSAARARQEGAEKLLAIAPHVRLIQFLDGDCEISEGWMQHASAYLEQHADVAAVCGRLAEREPERSVYNRLNSLQWRHAPVGEIEACGGVFMVRRDAYESCGGFNAALLVKEEAEFCSRLQSAGYRIVRTDLPMARHDTGMVRFGQWWARAVWGGYGDALSMAEGNFSSSARILRTLFSRFVWTLIVPIALLGSGFGLVWYPWLAWVTIGCAAAYAIVAARIYFFSRRRGDSRLDAVVYAFFCLVRKFPSALGFASYWLNRRGAARPDPHRAETVHPQSANVSQSNNKQLPCARTP